MAMELLLRSAAVLVSLQSPEVPVFSAKGLLRVRRTAQGASPRPMLLAAAAAVLLPQEWVRMPLLVLGSGRRIVCLAILDGPQVGAGIGVAAGAVAVADTGIDVVVVGAHRL